MYKFCGIKRVFIKLKENYFREKARKRLTFIVERCYNVLKRSVFKKLSKTEDSVKVQ